VPLIVSGPLVSFPGREVEDMVDITDLFQLFGKIAEVVELNRTYDRNSGDF
jgi:hypothetical protein